MTQLEKVQYTAKDHSDDGRLDVKVSSPGTPGTGANPELNHSPAAKLVFPRRRMIKSAVSSSPTRRSFLTGSAAAVAFGLVLLSGPSYAQTVSAADASVISPHPARLGAETEDTAIRPFRIRVPEAALFDLRQRVLATRCPPKETVSDQSRGVQLAKIQALVRYWGMDYDWRKVEAKLNALPQFVTNIDGIDIQFMHVRSRHPNALPLIITHGWPGSILELVKAIGPLTDPTAYGGRAEDAFGTPQRVSPALSIPSPRNHWTFSPNRDSV